MPEDNGSGFLFIMAVITTSPLKQFVQIKHFSASTLTDLDTAVNDFITGTLDVDSYDYFSVILGTSYFDGTDYVCAISYTRFENDTDWILPALS